MSACFFIIIQLHITRNTCYGLATNTFGIFFRFYSVDLTVRGVSDSKMDMTVQVKPAWLHRMRNTEVKPEINIVFNTIVKLTLE